MSVRPRIHHSIKEKLRLRRHKRKHGPSALRRAERRLPLQPKIDESLPGGHAEVIDAINEAIGVDDGRFDANDRME